VHIHYILIVGQYIIYISRNIYRVIFEPRLTVYRMTFNLAELNTWCMIFEVSTLMILVHKEMNNYLKYPNFKYFSQHSKWTFLNDARILIYTL